MDELTARRIAKQAGQFGSRIALGLFCEELVKAGVPIETINRAIDTLEARVAAERRRREAGMPPMIEGDLQ